MIVMVMVMASDIPSKTEHPGQPWLVMACGPNVEMEECGGGCGAVQWN